MHISIEHFDGKYPSFNINLHSKPGEDAFLSVKGCRIISGSKGDFISYPATKNEKTGKYWNHVYGGEKFNDAVLEKAREKPIPRNHGAVAARQVNRDIDDDIPF